MGTVRSALVVVAILSAACGDELPDQPTNPSPTLNLTGTWRGNIVVSNVTALMTWTLTQTSTSVTGPVLISLATGQVLMNGTVAGTLSGTNLAFTVTVPPGGILSQPGCTGQVAGATMAATTTMSGAYSVVNSTCATGLANGTFTMTRQ